MGGSLSVPASQIDAGSLHALAVQLRKPNLVCELIMEHDIDGLTAMELDESSVAEMVESSLDQKKVWAAIKQFRASQDFESSTEAVDSSLARRVTDLEQEVWELRTALESSKRPAASSPKRLDEEPMNLDERVRILEDEILALCDAAPQGSMLAANLPRLYYYRYGRNLDFRSLGFLKLSQLLAKMSRIEFDGSHRALVSKKLPNSGSNQHMSQNSVVVGGQSSPASRLFYFDDMSPPPHHPHCAAENREDLLPSYLLRESPLLN